MGVLTAAYERRLTVPSELSVCGFGRHADGRATRALPSPPRGQPIKKLARIATECLLACLEGKALPTRRYTLESKLVLRDSYRGPRTEPSTSYALP